MTTALQKISAPGAYKDLPMSFYHGDCCIGPSVSSTVLRAVEQRSLRHGWLASHLNPDKAESSKDHFRLGTALHSIAFECELSKKHFAISEFDEFRTNEAKRWRDAQINAGRTVLKKKDLKLVRDMCDALLEEPAIQQGLFDEKGEVETSVIHRDEETGLWLKARPDVVPINPILVDLKTTADASRRSVEYAVFDHGYHQQLALAAEVIEKVVGTKIEECWLVMIEKEPPHTVVFAEIDVDLIAWGRVQNRGAMRRFAECLAKGRESHHFPSNYRDGELTIRTPAWYHEQLVKRQETNELPTHFDAGITGGAMNL